MARVCGLQTAVTGPVVQFACAHAHGNLQSIRIADRLAACREGGFSGGLGAFRVAHDLREKVLSRL